MEIFITLIAFLPLAIAYLAISQYLLRQDVRRLEQTLGTPIRRSEPSITALVPTTERPKAKKKSHFSWTQFWNKFIARFQQRPAIWLGGIALSLGLIFLSKYALEEGLLTPGARLLLSFITGIFLFAGGIYAQALGYLKRTPLLPAILTGAGVVDLYSVLYAAYYLEFLHSFTSIIAMIGLSMAAIVTALLFGNVIAYFGIFGGYVTPLLFEFDFASTNIVFGLLYLILASALMVGRYLGQWQIALVAVTGAITWCVYWLLRFFTPADILAMYCFLIGMIATIAAFGQEDIKQKVSRLSQWIHYGGMGSAMVLIAVLMVHIPPDPLYVATFYILAVAGFIGAYFDETRYHYLPALSLIAILIFLVQSPIISNESFFTVAAITALLYVIASFQFVWRKRMPLYWASLGVVGGIASYVVAYIRLGHAIEMFVPPFFWSLLGIGGAFFMAYQVLSIMRLVPRNDSLRPKVLVLLVAAANAYISLAASFYFDYEFLSLAFAGQVGILTYLYQFFPFDNMRRLVMVFTGLFIAIVGSQIAVLDIYMAWGYYDPFAILNQPAGIVLNPLSHLVMPSVGLWYAAYTWQLTKYKSLASILYLIALTCFCFGLGILILWVFSSFRDSLPENPHYIVGNARLQAIVFPLVLTLALQHYWKNKILSEISCIAISMFTLVCFFKAFWLWHHEAAVGSWPLFNGLLLGPGLFSIYLWILPNYIPKDLPILKPLSKVAASLMLFIWLNYSIRHVFHGQVYSGDAYSAFEVYTYTLTWAMIGASFTTLGNYINKQDIKIGGFIVLALAIIKLFFYDSMALSGLYRVFAFLMLGAVLISLAYTHTFQKIRQ